MKRLARADGHGREQPRGGLERGRGHARGAPDSGRPRRVRGGGRDPPRARASGGAIEPAGACGSAYLVPRGASSSAPGAELGRAGVGHLSEIADAEAPPEPRGGPFQAWSVSELLRVGRTRAGAGPGGAALDPAIELAVLELAAALEARLVAMLGAEVLFVHAPHALVRKSGKAQGVGWGEVPHQGRPQAVAWAHRLCIGCRRRLNRHARGSLERQGARNLGELAIRIRVGHSHVLLPY